MNQTEHNQLLMIACRFGVRADECIGRTAEELIPNICEKCKAGFTSGIFGVHDHANCKIRSETGTVHFCLVERYLQRLLKGEPVFRHEFANNLCSFERDYVVYVFASRCTAIELCHYDINGLLQVICGCCRRGVKALLPDIKENGNCHGDYDESKPKDQENLAKKCWAHRVYYWQFDGYRLSDIFERV